MTASEIASRLAGQAEAVCQHLLPQGRAKGADWHCGSLAGEPGNSLKIRITGAKSGRWADFGGGSDDTGDMIGLWQRVRNLGLHDACEEACDWLNIPADQREAHTTNTYRPPAKIATREPSKTWLRLQSSLRHGTIAELAALAELRRFPTFAGLQLATDAGQLWFADVWDDGFDWPAWIITDPSRRNAQARRMDGQPWSGIGNAKAKTIVGSEANWPVGIAGLGTGDIALVEGGPDLLTAWFLVWFMSKRREIHPVAMLGASQSIHPEALPLFAGRSVWIFPHTDDNLAGAKGAARWSEQLMSVDATPLSFDLGGEKDLNDFVTSVTAELTGDLS